MMEAWFYYAILSGVFSGIYAFFLKISAYLNHNPQRVTFYSYVSSSLISFIFILLFGIEDIRIFYILLFFGFLNVVLYYISTQCRILSLKEMDSTIFFPVYKTIGPLFVLIISYFIFTESISFREFIGIVIGILVMYLLINKKENLRQKNLKLGLIYLFIATIFAVLSATLTKYISLQEFNIIIYIVFIQFFGLLVSGYFFATQKKIKKEKYFKKYTVIIGSLSGLINIATLYFFILALSGNFAIVYTINSFSILIPIILSVIIFKEHFDMKKGFGIVLSILALFLFY